MFESQLSLLASGSPGLPSSERVARTDLGRGAWIDFCPEWLPGADAWVDVVHAEATWRQDSRPMYDRIVDVPRMIWSATREELWSSELCELTTVVSTMYDREIRSVGANWYRDGRDSVAMHRDKVPNEGDALIVIVSLGDRRPFLLRPDDGRPTRRFALGHGDLLTMGGTTQAFFQHGVPKVAVAGPRISLMFRPTEG